MPLLRTTVDKGRSLFRVLLIEPTHHGGIQLLRYGFTAGCSFVVDFGLLYVFTSHLHWFYLLSASSSFLISLIINYLLSTVWVFARRDARARSKEISLFFIICAIAFGLNALFMWLFTSVMDIHYLYSKLLTVAIVFFWSFGARRILFHPAPEA